MAEEVKDVELEELENTPVATDDVEVETNVEGDVAEDSTEGYNDLDEVEANIEEAEADAEAQYDENTGDPIEGTEAADHAAEEDAWDEATATPEGSDVPVDFEFLETAGENMTAEGEDLIDLVGPSDNPAFNQIVVENEEGVLTLPDVDGTLVTQDLTDISDDDQDDVELTSLDGENPVGADGEPVVEDEPAAEPEAEPTVEDDDTLELEDDEFVD